MLKFKTIEELKPNPKLLELIKDCTYKTKKGKVKVLVNTNLQFIEPTEYLILSFFFYFKIYSYSWNNW